MRPIYSSATTPIWSKVGSEKGIPRKTSLNPPHSQKNGAVQWRMRWLGQSNNGKLEENRTKHLIMLTNISGSIRLSHPNLTTRLVETICHPNPFRCSRGRHKNRGVKGSTINRTENTHVQISYWKSQCLCGVCKQLNWSKSRDEVIRGE